MSYQELTEIVKTFGTESERGLDSYCEVSRHHAGLVFPTWSELVKDSGKQYVMCLHCSEGGHL